MNEIRCSIELRQDETRQSPGRLYGVLLQYETRAKDRPELFVSDSLHWPDDGIILNLSHDRKQPVIRFTPEQRNKEIVVDVPLPDTSRGRDAAIMIRNGTMRGLSVEFRAEQEGRRGGVREIRKAALTGAALVDDGAYHTPIEIRQTGNRLPRLWL